MECAFGGERRTAEKEEAMVDELRKGVPMLEVDKKYAYEAMLKK